MEQLKRRGEFSPNLLVAELARSMASFACDAAEACGLSSSGFRVSVLDERPQQEGYLLDLRIARADGQPGELRLPIVLPAGAVLSLPELEQRLAAALNVACGIGVLA